MFSLKNSVIAIIGLGYVGLPLALEFSRKFKIVGFDINKTRVNELNKGIDSTLEVDNLVFPNKNLHITNDPSSLIDANIYIITVPTPIDKENKPNLEPLMNACTIVGEFLKESDIVIFESTVYPGATEEVCVPILEKISNLEYNKNFFVGYSPERINPGDKEHRLSDIVKVTSGSNEESAVIINDLYASIIKAGTHKASSIKVAEAAKVIENTQRDVNIALINELSIIFNKLEIDTHEVLEAASTKWNFLPFQPGIVGGHCIGVDPYYLTHKAESIGYSPEIILAGRRLNDSMGRRIAKRFIDHMIKNNIKVKGANVLLMGLTFKENCPDIRNTKVVDIIQELDANDVNIDITDPWCSADQVMDEYGIHITKNPKNNFYDGVILAVAHDIFIDKGIEHIQSYGKNNYILFDVKGIFDINDSDLRL